MTWEHIRTWEGSPYLPGKGPAFRLELFDTGRTGGRRAMRNQLGYLFFVDGRLLFAGDDFGPSPMYCDDSDEALGALLSFLALKPGDTDREYFDDYTPAQLAFAEEHGESLSMMADDLERGAAAEGGAE